MKRFLCLATALLLVLGSFTPALADTAHTTLSYVDGTTLKESAINAVACIVIDNVTQEVLYQRNADMERAPASITKIMTCLLTLEYAQTTSAGLQEKVTVRSDWKPMRKDYSQIKVQPNEVFTLEQLLYGLMLPSGNDAAEVIAEHIDGSISAFADRMNAKAAELGMTSSHFVNPHGITAEGHVVTARDMALLGHAAMENETFREIVATQRYKCPATNKTEARTWTNSNAFYGNNKDHPELKWDLSIGVKTGYTDAAGMTFVGAAKDGDREVLCVVLGAADTVTRFNDAKRLMMYGLCYYTTLDLRPYALNRVYTAVVPYAKVDNPRAGQAELEAGKEFQIGLRLSEPIWLTLPVGEADVLTADPVDIRVEVSLRPGLAAPLSEGEELGTAAVTYHGRELISCPVYITQNVERQEPYVEPTAALLATEDGRTATITPLPDGTIPPTPSGDYWIIAAVGLTVVLIIALLVLLFARRPSKNTRRSHTAGRTAAAPSARTAARRASSARRRR